jgi:hypothetical protein
MPAFALMSNSLRFEGLLDDSGMEGAYPDPGLSVDAVELFGRSGGYILICSE